MKIKKSSPLVFICLFCFFLYSCDGGKSEVLNKIDEELQNGNNSINPIENTHSETFTGSEETKLLLDNGLTFYRQGNTDNALANFLKVYEVDSSNVIALANIGNIYYDINQNEKAIEFYEKTLLVNPDDLNVRSDLGTCYSRLGQFEKGIELNMINIEKDYNHPMSHYNLSALYFQLDRKEEAEAEMKIYEEIMSKHPH